EAVPVAEPAGHLLGRAAIHLGDFGAAPAGPAPVLEDHCVGPRGLVGVVLEEGAAQSGPPAFGVHARVEVADRLAVAAPAAALAVAQPSVVVGRAGRIAAAPQVAGLAEEFVGETGLGLVGMGGETGYDGANCFGFGHGSSPQGGMGERRVAPGVWGGGE